MVNASRCQRKILGAERRACVVPENGKKEEPMIFGSDISNAEDPYTTAKYDRLAEGLL